MPNRQRDLSDGIPSKIGTDYSELANEFDIDPGALETALDDAAGLLKLSRESVRPAEKRALRGVATALAEVIDRTSVASVRARLIGSLIEMLDEPDEDDLAAYTVCCAARDRVDLAIEGAKDLLTIVRAAQMVRFASGRRGYEDQTVAISSLRNFWIYVLERKVTISGHADDGRRITPSHAVAFVHRCMNLIGEDISEQACRTILQKLKD